LGLAITESLVKLQGGSLAWRANLAKGAVSISVAHGKASRSASTRRQGRAETAATPKILTIEDDRMASHLLESQLSSSGYEVISCNHLSTRWKWPPICSAGNHAGPADEAHERLGDPAAIEV